MKELIEQFQRGENKRIIQKVLSLIDMDLKAIKENNEELPEGDLFFIAYRIRALLMKDALQAMNYHNKYNRQDRRAMVHEFNSYIESLFNASDYAERDEYGVLKVGFAEVATQVGFENLEIMEYYFNFDEIVNKNKYDSLFDNELELMSIFPHEYRRILELARELQDTSKESETFKGYFEGSKERLLSPLIRGLEFALHKVDPNRSPREVVRYVNRAMFTKYIELFQKEQGKKRIYDTKTKKNYFVDTSFDVDPWLLILIWNKKGHTLRWLGIEAFKSHLTKSQREFLLQLFEAVQEELEKENQNAFRWTKKGEPVIQKRYFAKKLGMEEASFKMKLMRATRKVKENWEEVLASR